MTAGQNRAQCDLVMPAKKLRTETIRVMLTPDERAAFQARAEIQGLSLSAYLRQLGLQAMRAKAE